MSDDWNPLVGALDPRRALQVNANPVQRPGDRLLRTACAGGPEHDGDRRLYLSAKVLRDLLHMAEASPLQRVQVQRCGVRVDLYQTPSGHTYEVWTFIGADPKPEALPAVLRGG